MKVQVTIVLNDEARLAVGIRGYNEARSVTGKEAREYLTGELQTTVDEWAADVRKRLGGIGDTEGEGENTS